MLRALTRGPVRGFVPSMSMSPPRLAFAAVSTHDLPTIAGLWSGADLRDQAAAGVSPDAREAARLRRRLLKASGLGPDATTAAVTVALHRELAASPSMIATLSYLPPFSELCLTTRKAG